MTLTNFVAKTVFAVCAWFARSKSLGLVPLAVCTASGWPIPALVIARYWNGGSDNTKRKLGNITIASAMMQRAIQRRLRTAAPLLWLTAVLCLGSAAPAPAQVTGGPTLHVSGSGLFQSHLFSWGYHIEILGSDWDANSAVTIHLYGPLNTLGAQPTDRVLGTVYADGAGIIQPGAYVVVPLYNGTNGTTDITRPGNYQVYAPDPRPNVPRHFSERFNIGPRTGSFVAPDRYGNPSTINWPHSRGCRDGWYGDMSPERSDPEWASIWSEQPVAMYATVTPTTALIGVSDPGLNQPSFMAISDFPSSHYGHDWNVDLVPDADYGWVLADANFFSEVTVLGKSNAGRIECEWETLNNGTPVYGSYGHGNIGFPLWAKPTSGDRVYMVGRWVLDNGHPDTGDRTEIHPPRLVATMRKRNTAVAQGDVSGSLTRASQVDIYVSGHGGGCNHFPDGLSAALDNGGAGGGRIEDVLSSGQLDAYFRWGPADPLIDGIYYDVLDVLQALGDAPPGDIHPSAGPIALGWTSGPEFRPINTMDYDFDVPLPPAPAGATNPLVRVLVRPENTASTDEVITYTTPDPSTGLPTVAHIHLPFNGVENGIYARTLYFYWDTFSAPGYHFVVELDDVRMTNAPGFPFLGPQPLYLWADVCGQWVSLTDLAPADFLTQKTSFQPGFDQATFPAGSAKFDVYLDTNDTMRVYTTGYAQRDYDYLFGVDVGLTAYAEGLRLAGAEEFGSGNNQGPGGALFESNIATPGQFNGVQSNHTSFSQNVSVTALNGGTCPNPVFSVDFKVTYVPGSVFPPQNPRYWVGGSGAWSTPSHWSPIGVPQNGEDLIFDNSPGSNMTNDLGGLIVRSLQFNHSGAVWGQGLTVTTAITAVSADNQPLEMNFYYLILGGNVTISEDVPVGFHLTLNCPVDLNGHDLTAGSAHAGPLIFQNRIYGAGNLNFTNGISYLSNSGVNANSFTGRVTVSGGATLYLDSSTTPAIPSDLLIEYGATVRANRGSQTAITSTVEIFGGGSFLGNGTTAIGDLVLNNILNDLIPCTVSCEILEINGTIASRNDSSFVTPIIKGEITLNHFTPIWTAGSTLVVAGLDVSASIFGTGFSKAGNAAMILDGINFFTGGVEVDQGTLDVGNSGALGATSGVLLYGAGTMTLRDSISGCPLEVRGSQQITDETAGSLLTADSRDTISRSGPIIWSGPVQLDTNLVVKGGDITFSGAISGPGGVDFRNSGTALITGPDGNTFSGVTRVRCPLLEFKKPAGTKAFAGPLVVGGGAFDLCEARWLNSYQNVYATATLYADGFINLTNNNEDFGAVTFNGGKVDSGPGGNFTIYQPLTVNHSSAGAVIYGNLGLPAGGSPPTTPAVFIVADGPADCDLTVNAQIYGSPQYFVKQGAGTMCLRGVNTYDAVTLLEGGILDINNSSSLGTDPGLVVFDAATLRLSGSGSLPRGFEVVGSGVGGTHGALETTLGSSFSFAGGVLLDAATTFNVGTGTSLQLGAISGTGPLTKIGGGRLTFSGSANSYTGDTVVSAGLLFLDKTLGATGVPRNLVIGPGPSSSSPATVFFEHGTSMGGNTVTINANATLNLQGNNLAISQLNLNDGGSAVTGAGALVFNPGGQINVGSQSSAGSHHSASISGNIQIAPNDVVTFFVALYAPFFPFDFAPELDLPAALSRSPEDPNFVPGFIVKEGQGQLRLSGNNTYKGPTTINNGTLIAASPAALGTTDNGTFVNHGAALALDGGIAINNEGLYLSSSNAAALQTLSGSNTWSGPITLSQPSGISVSPANGYLQALNTVSGTGGLTKLGPGTLQFWGFGPNSYSGGTTVAGGTLEAGRVSQVSVPGDLGIGNDTTSSNTATLQIDREQQFSPAANVTVHSSGRLYLNDLPNLGVPTPTIGTLSGGGTVYLGANASLTVSNSAYCSFTGPISGAGAFKKNGTAKLQLTANNTYTGDTTISAGTLQVDGNQPQSRIQNSAWLQGSGTVGTINMNTSSAVIAPGASPGILTCSNITAAAGQGARGSLEIELSGPAPGTGYDQLNVHGTVNLSNITLNASLNFASSLSDTFTIINNAGADPVVGTFTGLAQGATLNLGSQSFQISYTGGDGNDVVLSHTLPTLTAKATAGGIFIKNPDQPSYPYYSTVTLTAVPLLGYAFTGWSGDASGTQNPLPLTMTASKVITANFVSTVSDLIVDNTNATFTGSWTTDSGSAGTGFYGQDYAYTLTVSTASATAQFRPNLPVGGNYDVYVWYPFITQNNKRCSDAEYLISAAGGTNTVSVNQKSSNLGWFQIASGQRFSSGTAGYVQLSNQSTDTGRNVAADAVRWAWSTNQVTQPYFTGVTRSLTNATLTWLSGSNYVYRLQYKTNLTDAAWLDVSGDVTATTGTASKTVSTPGNALRGFYRVELLP